MLGSVRISDSYKRSGTEGPPEPSGLGFSRGPGGPRDPPGSKIRALPRIRPAGRDPRDLPRRASRGIRDNACNRANRGNDVIGRTSKPPWVGGLRAVRAAPGGSCLIAASRREAQHGSKIFPSPRGLGCSRGSRRRRRIRAIRTRRGIGQTGRSRERPTASRGRADHRRPGGRRWRRRAAPQLVVAPADLARGRSPAPPNPRWVRTASLATHPGLLAHAL